MKYELKRISIWSVIKISFVLNLILGFFVGMIWAFMFFVITTLPMRMMGDQANEALPAISGVVAVFIPFFAALGYAVVGTIMTAIMTVAYNLLARITGGIEWELQEVVQVAPVPIYQTPVPPPQPTPPTPPPPAPETPSDQL